MAEELDSVATIPIAMGIHLVATAVLCSASPGSAELALAGEILRQNPRRSMPRELESSIDTFNRHMDAAIESCNDSIGEATRAGRRARLASDLERAGLVLIEQSTLAELLERQLAGELDRPLSIDTFPDEEDGLDEGEDLGAELSIDAAATSAELGALGLELAGVEGVSFITHTPSVDVGVLHGATSAAATSSQSIGVDDVPYLSAVND